MFIRIGMLEHLGVSVIGLTEHFQRVYFRRKFFMLFLYLPSGMTLQAGQHKNNVRYFHHRECVTDPSGSVRASEHQSDNCNYPNFDLLRWFKQLRSY